MGYSGLTNGIQFLQVMSQNYTRPENNHKILLVFLLTILFSTTVRTVSTSKLNSKIKAHLTNTEKHRTYLLYLFQSTPVYSTPLHTHTHTHKSIRTYKIQQWQNTWQGYTERKKTRSIVPFTSRLVLVVTPIAAVVSTTNRPFLLPFSSNI